MAEMNNLPYDLSNLSREDMDRMMSDYNSDAVDLGPMFTKGGARAAARGLTLGASDEFEAAVRSAMDGGLTYKDAHNQISKEMKQFDEDNPAASFVAENVAGMVPLVAAPVALASKTALRAAPRAINYLKSHPYFAGGAGFGALMGIEGFNTGLVPDGERQSPTISERLEGAGEGTVMGIIGGLGLVGGTAYLARKSPAFAKFFRNIKRKTGIGSTSVMDDAMDVAVDGLDRNKSRDYPTYLMDTADPTNALENLTKTTRPPQVMTPDPQRTRELVYGEFDRMTAAENARMMEMQKTFGDLDVTE